MASTFTAPTAKSELTGMELPQTLLILALAAHGEPTSATDRAARKMLEPLWRSQPAAPEAGLVMANSTARYDQSGDCGQQDQNERLEGARCKAHYRTYRLPSAEASPAHQLLTASPKDIGVTEALVRELERARR